MPTHFLPVCEIEKDNRFRFFFLQVQLNTYSLQIGSIALADLPCNYRRNCGESNLAPGLGSSSKTAEACSIRFVKSQVIPKRRAICLARETHS